jgi:glutamine synthetase
MSLRVAAVDLNGQWRGKRLPASALGKARAGHVRMPVSAAGLDVTGVDPEGSPLVLPTGDVDGWMVPTGREVPMPWLARPATLIATSLASEDGTPFPADPRVALSAAVERWRARGLEPVAAVEMEFVLVDRTAPLRPPASPLHGRRVANEDCLSLAALDEFAAFLDAVEAGAEAMGLPLEGMISEGCPGQMEVNLSHRDALTAADDAALLKLLVKGVAARQGMAATFMAKPYADEAGSGMHVHLSLERGGRNATAEALPQVVAGCLAAMPDSTAVFAPHGVSYGRLAPGLFAPASCSWGRENRTCAIRLPAGGPEAARIEHRVAGADANPHLLLATILGSALMGVEDGLEPPPETVGDAYGQDLPRLAVDWEQAVDRLSSPAMARILDPLLVTAFAAAKRQEMRRTEGLDRAALEAIYRDAV